ncbi:MAG TPA: hypothetical protein VGM18_02460 [Candidatus Sulfotelmatobacter sp.]|jgi:hypothetical protein
MSRKEAKWNAAQAASAQAAYSRILHSRFLHTRILYRRIFSWGTALVALLTCLASFTSNAAAQREEERPQIIPGNRNVPRKKDAGPRAVGVLQITANGKSSLIPIAILTGGKFWDATAYKADPIPMALESGTVYEAERTGTSLGLFTVSSALHSNAANVPSPWIGTGKWVPAGSEQKTALKAETVPAGIDTGDAPPRLTRDPAKVHNAPDGGARSSSAPSSTPSKPSSDSGDEPPRITKGTPPLASAPPPTGQGPPASGTPSSTPAGDSKSSDPKPSDTKAGDNKPDANAKTAENIPESDSGATEANRPTLRRGKPVEPLPEDEIPGYSKPGATAPSSSGAKSAEPAAGLNASGAQLDKAAVQLIPAISDATGPDPRAYGFTWLKDEEGERRQQLIGLAKEKVRAYVEARAKARISPVPAHAASTKTSSMKPSSPKVKDPILENVQMAAYDLWNTNQPVIVFSAEAHMPPPPAGAAFSAVDAELTYPVTLVAYPDIYNNLHPIYVGVTDKFHLDLTPRLELIDAVDADGDLRGELLFRQTSDVGTGWVIYRASADKLWKLFDSLHPE